MEILLLANSRGLIRYDFMHLTSKAMPLEVVGAPEGAVITIKGDRHTLRKRLVNGTCTVELEPIKDGNVSFIVSHGRNIWNVEGIRIDSTEDGGVDIRSLADYAEMINAAVTEIENLKTTIEKLKDRVKRIEDSGIKPYNII
jgi:hypothetical protein